MFINGNKIETIHIADNFWLRFKGLMGKSQEKIEKLGGLHIKPCAQIHTFFMKCAIDVIYIDRQGKVLHIDKSAAPSKSFKKVKGAKSVIELPDGYSNEKNIEINDVLEVRPC